MKKTILIMMVAILSLQSCIVVKTNGTTGKNNTTWETSASDNFSSQPMETKTINVGDFSGIEVETAIKVFIKPSTEKKVVITSNALKYVSVKNKDGKLAISYDSPNGVTNANTEITIYTHDLKKISAESASKIFVEDGFQFTDLELDISSASQMQGKINARNLKAAITSASKFDADLDVHQLDIEATSAAKVNLSGKTHILNIEATSAAKVNAEKLQYETVNIDHSTLGKVLTLNSNSLNIKLI
ncbi:GIN domain-containing protein [Daejeonia sp. YH14]|uniref:GIN domain-containing protein n=1 Tax=Daejeonia sp. YH14 TaxID=3439042 RepID=UPI003F49593D